MRGRIRLTRRVKRFGERERSSCGEVSAKSLARVVGYTTRSNTTHHCTTAIRQFPYSFLTITSRSVIHLVVTRGPLSLAVCRNPSILTWFHSRRLLLRFDQLQIRPAYPRWIFRSSASIHKSCCLWFGVAPIGANERETNRCTVVESWTWSFQSC